ncbi:MAG: hypothetical protein NDJ89_05085 [Oligoflexia bacterium]|nr:hypothetical protein [Oligoflexia bacterium]
MVRTAKGASAKRQSRKTAPRAASKPARRRKRRLSASSRRVLKRETPEELAKVGRASPPRRAASRAGEGRTRGHAWAAFLTLLRRWVR